MLASCALVVCLLVVCDIASSARSDYEGHFIQPDVQTHWGAWGSIEWCKEGTFADGFHQSIVPRLGPFGDDTALSGIGLRCVQVKCSGSSHQDSSWIYSARRHFGGGEGIHRGDDSICRHGYNLAGAQVRSESDQGTSDDTAVNSYRFICRHLTSSSSYELHGHDGHWGSWSGWKSCPMGTAICGIKTQFELGTGDATGINDAIFYCCKIPDPCFII